MNYMLSWTFLGFCDRVHSAASFRIGLYFQVAVLLTRLNRNRSLMLSFSICLFITSTVLFEPDCILCILTIRIWSLSSYSPLLFSPTAYLRYAMTWLLILHLYTSLFYSQSVFIYSLILEVA